MSSPLTGAQLSSSQPGKAEAARDAERLAQASGGALVYSRLVEGLVRVIRTDPRSESLDLLNRVALDDDHLLGSYPVLVWEDILRRVAQELYPDLKEEPSWDVLGYKIVRAYFETPVGKALWAVARLMGTHRSLARTVNNFETTTNYLKTTYTELGAARATVSIHVLPNYLQALTGRPVAFPVLRAGALRGAMDLLGVAGGQVQLTEQDLRSQRHLYLLSWQEA